MSTITISDLMHLSVAERLRLVEDLWDSIAAEAEHDPRLLPVTEEQKSLLRRRSESYRRNPGAAIPLDEALARIERSLG
jgi:putative addiction module component (TIGR02574 family)